MPKKFAEYTYLAATAEFDKAKKDWLKNAEAAAFVKGDDWQDGKGWTGPQFEGNTKLSAALKKAVGREFTAKGTVKTTARRHRRGVIGRVPTWQVVSRNAPSDPNAEIPKEIADRIAEAQLILNEFWKNSQVHKTLKNLVDDYLSADRGILRLYFVQSDMGGFEIDIPATVEQAVKLIRLFREEPEMGLVVTDKTTLQKSSFFRYADGTVNVIEQCYVEDGETVFRKLRSQTDLSRNAERIVSPYLAETSPATETLDQVRLPLGGKLLVYEMVGSGFVTSAMCSNQKLQNKAFTMMSHNLDTAGFRSTLITNGMPPGEFQVIDGKQTYVVNEDGFQFGAGQINYVGGRPIIEKNGTNGDVKTGVVTPGVHESEPVAVTTFADTITESGNAILEDADQKHITIAGDANVSGEAQIQAREDYAGSLEDTKSDLDDCCSNVFEAVLALVAYLMNQPDRYADLQVNFAAILNAGPVSVEERAQAVAEADGNYRTRESAMELIGIVDPDAMAAAIKQQLIDNPPPEPSPAPTPKPKPEPAK